MKKRCVKIYGINNAIELVDMANKVDGDITLSRGKYAVDAKSILGVLAINTADGVIIDYPETATEFETYVKQFEILTKEGE